LSGTGPASVISQTGESKKIVEWVQAADEDIQNMYPDWEFLRDDFSFSTIAAQQSYTPTQAGESTLANWKVNERGDVRIYSSVLDESYLVYMPWQEFKSTYLFGSSRSQTGRPTVFSIKPNNSIIFHPIPNAVFNCNGEFYGKAVTMATNTADPQFPSQFHMILVWRALTLYGAYDAADERYTHGQNEYLRILTALKRDQMPQITWG